MLPRLIVQLQPLISTTGRNLQKISIRHQIIRQINRDSRENIAQSKQASRHQSLVQKIKTVAIDYAPSTGRAILMFGPLLGLAGCYAFGVDIGAYLNSFVSNNLAPIVICIILIFMF